MPSSTLSSSRQLFKSEQEYKRKLVALLQERGAHTQLHEDKDMNYVPDLSCAINGCDWWIEIKYCKKVPPKLSSIEHYTKGQRDWLVKRGQAGGGRCYLLVGLPQFELLIDYSQLLKLHDRSIDYVQTHAMWFPDLSSVVRHIVW